MEKMGAEKSPFAKVDQVGIIVKDINEAVKYYESLGIGPFETLKGITVIERKVYGRVAEDVSLNVRIAQAGPLQIELIQPSGGKSPWKDFLDTKGEGINHLGFFIDDIEKETAKLEEKGFKVLCSSRFENGGGAVYFDIDRVGGVLFELIQW